MNTEAMLDKTRVVQRLLDCIEEAMVAPGEAETPVRLAVAIIRFGEHNGRTLTEEDLLRALVLVTGQGKLEIRRELSDLNYTPKRIFRNGEALLISFIKWLFSSEARSQT